MGKRSSSYKSQVQILRRRVATEAALATFAENGCFSTSMQDVAERAGMATGTLYADHASKVELLEDAFSEAMAEIRTRLSVGETGGGARRDLTQLTDGLLALLASEAPLAAVLDGRLGCNLHWSGAGGRPAEWLEEEIVSLLERAEAQGQIRFGINKQLAAQIYFSMFGVRRLMEMLRDGARAGLAEELVSYFFDGLTPA